MIEAFETRRFEEVSSTQDVARELLSAGLSSLPVAVIAKAQTKGRGRYDRTWHSPEGGLYMTMVMKPQRPQDVWSQISYITGISMAEAILQLDPSVGVKLKWVNDIIIQSKKAGGILLELDNNHLLVGVGINLKRSDALSQYNGVALNEVASGVDAERLSASFLKRFVYNYNIWVSSGFEPIRSLWLRMAQGVGKGVVVRFKDSEENGTFIGVDETGQLQLLQDDNNIKLISAGELYFGS